MSADEFGCRMNNNICTVLDWTNQIRSCESAVNNQRDLMCMSDLGNSLDIYYIRVRISKSLDVNCLGVLLDRILYFLKIEYINECCCDSVCRKCMFKKVCCSTVDVLGCYNVISLLCKVLNGVCDSCCTGCYCRLKVPP